MSALSDRLRRLFDEGHAAPRDDLLRDARLSRDANLVRAAVLIAMTEREDRPGFLLLHRPSHMRSHPGQVAFPGGRLDPGESAVEAALREAWEELGIRPETVRVIGTSDVYHAASGYEITPVVGMVPPDIEIFPNPAEVAQWFEAPVDFVLDPANQNLKESIWNGNLHRYIEIMWKNHRIWGVTGAIIANLTRRLNWHG